MEFGKKSTFGYKVVDSSSDWTHYIVEAETLEEFMEEHRELQEKTELQAKKLDQATNTIQHYADKIAEYEEEKKQIKKKMRKIKDAWDEERKENFAKIKRADNMHRIYVEKVNANRGLTPKKAHSGYCVVSSTQREYSYKNRYSVQEKVILWETILETPYVVDFTSDEVEEYISELYTDREDGTWPIEEIGISAHYGDRKWTEKKIQIEYGEEEEYEVEREQVGKYEEMIASDDFKDDYQEYNVMLRHQLRANYRSGHWELMFYHTKPLGIVPDKWRIGKGR